MFPWFSFIFHWCFGDSLKRTKYERRKKKFMCPKLCCIFVEFKHVFVECVYERAHIWYERTCRTKSSLIPHAFHIVLVRRWMWVEWTWTRARRSKRRVFLFCNPWVEGSCRFEMCIFLSYVICYPDPYRRFAFVVQTVRFLFRFCLLFIFILKFNKENMCIEAKNTRNSRT